jgi:hypothetical protein
MAMGGSRQKVRMQYVPKMGFARKRDITVNCAKSYFSREIVLNFIIQRRVTSGLLNGNSTENYR